MAVLLAVFLAGWAWLYLYQRCATKFWIFIVSYVATVAVAITVFVSVFNTFATECNVEVNTTCQPQFPTTLLWIVALSLVQLGFHVWAVIDVSTKSQSWYDNYE